MVDKQEEGSHKHGLEGEVDFHKAGHMVEEVVVVVVDIHKVVHKVEKVVVVVVDIQHWEAKVDQCETSVALLVEPLPVVVAQTHRLSCLIQSCVESACMRRPCSKRSRISRRGSGLLLGFLHFRQSLRRWRRCKQLVVGRT